MGRYVFWVDVRDWKRERVGNGNAVSCEMRKGGRNREKGEREREAIRYSYADAPVALARRKKCKTSGVPLPVTSIPSVLSSFSNFSIAEKSGSSSS